MLLQAPRMIAHRLWSWRAPRSSNEMWDDLFPEALDGLAHLRVRWPRRMPKAEHQVVDPRLALQRFDLPDAVGG